MHRCRRLPALTLRGVRTTAVEVPLRYVLGTSAATVRAAPLLLVDVETEQGIVGRAYVFCYRRSGARAIAAVLHEAAELVAGEAVAPLADRRQARSAASRCIGVTGVVRMALSALDMALWDALAVAAGLPLATLLGGAPRPMPRLQLVRPRPDERRRPRPTRPSGCSKAASRRSSCGSATRRWPRTSP